MYFNMYINIYRIIFLNHAQYIDIIQQIRTISNMRHTILRHSRSKQKLYHTQYANRIENRVVQQKDHHSWKCYLNNDVNIQYHRLMMQKSRKKTIAKSLSKEIQSVSSQQNKLLRMKNPQQFLYLNQQNTYQKRSISKKIVRRINTQQLPIKINRLNSQYSSSVSTQKYLPNCEKKVNYKLSEYVQQTDQKYKTVNRVNSMNNIQPSGYESGSSSYLAKNSVQGIQRKKALHTTIGLQSSDRISDDLESINKLNINSHHINKSQNMENSNTLYDRLERKKINIRHRKQNRMEKKQQDSQTEQMIVLKPQIHKMQEEQRRYLRDKFIDHYGLAHPKKY